jgi:uncharacterized protein YigA (DUF484 family)
MRAEDVAKYLHDHPQFFDEYAELLSTIHVAHPYGGHAIPLAERQVLSLRERGRALEGKLRELVQFGEENDTTSDRLHRVTLALLAAEDRVALLGVLYASLREEFDIAAVAVRLWPRCGNGIDAGPENEPVSEEARVFADSLLDPYFSAQPMFESAAWFPGQPVLASLVYVPLRAQETLGVLALGSTDATRFRPDMGTLYLMRLGELLSAALQRCEGT